MEINLGEIFKESNLGYIISNEQGKILYRNKKAEIFLKCLSLDENESVIEKLQQISPRFDLSEFFDENMVCSFTNSDGALFHFEIKVYPKIIEGKKCFVFNIYEISRYKNKIKDTEIYETIFNSVASTIVITDAKGRIEKVNPSFEKLTGYSAEEAKGKNPRILNSGYHSKKFFENLWKTIKSGKTWSGVFRDVIKNGDLIWEKSIISPIKNSKGEVVKYVAIKENITKEKMQEMELKKFSYQDYLTGLYNRRKFNEYTGALLESALENDINLYCLMIDVDNFKKVNDTYGHETGDTVLVELAEVLKLNVRGQDIASRYGGEEFVVILSKYSFEQALLRAEKIREDIEKMEFFANQGRFSITASIGFSPYNSNLKIPEWLNLADEALYEAKHTGKNRVCQR